MGVPIITRVGRSHISRVGLSILKQVGLDFFAATTDEAYVAKAAALADNLDGLTKLRASMRQRMKDSTLCDARRFARKVETAYRNMWRRWCGEQAVYLA